MAAQSLYFFLLSLGLTSALITPSLAQEDSGGFQARLTFGERFEWSDSETVLLSRLNFEGSTETRNQSLNFSIGGALETDLSDGGRTDFSDPNASLAYEIQNSNTLVSFGLSYKSQDIERLSLEDELDPSTGFLDTGEREDIRANIGFQFGREAPFGGSFSYGIVETNYNDIVAANLFDQKRETTNLDFRLRFDPRILGTVSLNRSDVDRDGGVDTLTQRATFGVDFDISKTLTASAIIGRTKIKTSGTTPSTSEQATNFAFALNADRPNGTLSGSISSDIDENGRRSDAIITRALELPRGSLRLGVGASRDGDTSKTRPIYEVTYAHELPRGEYKIDGQSQFSSNSAGNEVLSNRISLQWSRVLNSLSRISTDFTWRKSNIIDAAGNDTRATELGISYSRNLNEKWTLKSGYQYKRRSSSSGETDKDNTLFVELSTIVDW